MPIAIDTNRKIEAIVFGKDVEARADGHEWKSYGEGRLQFYGCNRCAKNKATAPELCAPHVFDYEHDISLAWEVLEKVREKGILLWPMVSPGGSYKVRIRHAIYRPLYQEWVEGELEPVFADTAPEAICRAALSALSMLTPV